jgi:dUTPase
MSYYRLELCPTTAGLQYYRNVIHSTNENAGIDLYCVTPFTEDIFNNEGPYMIDLGTSARMVRVDPDRTETEVHYWLCPRSSICKTGMMMANSQGVIDRSYRGTLKAPVWLLNKSVFTTYFSKVSFQGSRSFQVVAPDMGWIREVRVVENLNETSRGSGGFGSTGQ